MLILVPTGYEAAQLFGDEIVRELAGQDLVAHPDVGADVQIGICGFGLAGSGVRTGYLLEQMRQKVGDREVEQRVLLTGIAGSLQPDKLSPGGVLCGTKVVCHGIGIGEGAGFVSAAEAGWSQAEHLSTGDSLDELELQPLVIPQQAGLKFGEILSVTAASASTAEADRHRERYPNALAEEMEGFSFALACKQVGASAAILRGVSNVAGKRDKELWKVRESLHNVQEVLNSLIEQE